MSLHNPLSRLSLLAKHGKAIGEELSTSYTYIPIDEAADEIRLLTLHRGKRKDPIKITLNNTPFTVDHVPAFEALSYTWGSPKNRIDIFVSHSGSSFNSLSVTENLGVALPFLRYKDRDRVLWIDAICVNQQDLEERSQQVQRMAQIYSKAVRVIAWLGPSTKRTPVAIRCFDTINSNFKGNWGSGILEAVLSDASWADDTVAPPFKAREYFAMEEFLSYEWFQRLWIYQEIRLSPSGSILLCGKNSIQWESFRNVVYFLQRKMPVGNASTSFRDRIFAVNNLCSYHQTLPLAYLVEQTKHCKCSDPRDRIFALLSMVPKFMRGSGITPDYTKSLRDVYTDAVKSIIAYTGNLDIILGADMNESTQCTPTWVPDWSRPRTTLILPTGYASGISRGASKFPSKGVLQVEGTISDSIIFAEPFQSPSAPWPVAREVKRIVLRLLPTIFGPGEFGLSSMCRTLCAGDFSERYIPPQPIRPGFLQTVKHIGEIIFAQEYAWPALNSHILSTIRNFLYRRCVCRTSKGLAVLAPETTRQGDIVTVFLGCSNPMILRSTQNGAFKVIGEAYCNELAEGDALMGPLPGNFKIVSRWMEKRNNQIQLFLNSKDGSFHSEDPRLSQIPLPLGWRRKLHEDEEWWPWFINDITMEEGHQDPRLTAEAFRERGVAVQTFSLV
ncbi:hypothetical protein N431DRAFT_335433 [Stipitochalara longipes BDJ]|nr:hypothetical protein N431DRAFT_335433 [Stipitochalara longipes BDJ]